MGRRALLFCALSVFASGCASVRSLVAADAAPEPVAELPRTTPERAYADGVTFLQRGEFELARREWDRCLALSSADSPARLDCLVALERLERPGGLEAEP